MLPEPVLFKKKQHFFPFFVCEGKDSFFYLVCEAIGTAATPDLLCQPRVIVKMIVEKQGKPKFSEKTCPSATFAHHKIPHDQTRVF
jgi:hypothetical protein